MLDSKFFYFFLFSVLIFVIGGIIIIRFVRLISYLFFPNDYFTENFNEIEPIIKIKNTKLAWALSFFLLIPVFCGLYFLKYANIGGFIWYLSLYSRPKTAFYTLGSIYFIEALIFLIFILEKKIAIKGYKNKSRLIRAAIFYAIMITILFTIAYRYKYFE